MHSVYPKTVNDEEEVGMQYMYVLLVSSTDFKNEVCY